MKTLEFSQAYEKLNKEQKQAVDTIDGPVMVIAGPGTGKTQILTLRIANILLETDTAPESILALTFTDAGVRSMRERLTSIIGSTAHRVGIFTFHGLAHHVIEQYPEKFPLLIGAAVASDSDRYKVIEEILESQAFEMIKPFGDHYYYVSSILAEISGLKREGVSPEDFLIAQEAEKKAIAENEDTYHSKGAHKGKMKKIYADQLLKIKKNKELAFVYEVYEKNLHEKRLMDYEDIIVEFISALKRDADFTLMLQEQYQYILADEHQDANQSQNTILELLSAFHENPNIFVVGDEKQAIYRFQGASLANFLYFKELYPTATLLSLKNNYRSTQHILDASHSLILHNAVYDEKLQVELVSHSEHDNTPIALYDFDDEHTELHYITAHIQKRIEDGVDSREIAVLVRENNDTFKVARYLEHKNIPFQNLSSENLLQDPLIAGLVYVLKSIIDPLNDVWFARALHTDIVGIDPLSAHKMITYAKKKRIPMYEVFARLSEFQSGSDGKELKSISIDAQKESFAEWVRMSSNETALTILSSLIEKSTYLKKVSMGGNGISAISKIKTFLDFAESVLRRRSNNGLAVLLDELVTMETYNISIPFSGSELRDGVRIMTGHKSKGREYEFVYVPFLRDGYWGGKRKRNKFSISVGVYANHELSGNLDDERRLFYVALTRAKKQAVISFSRIDAEGKEFIPSVFIDEIRDDLLTREHIPTESVDGGLVLHTKKDPVSLYDKGYIQDIFINQGFSVTALNNFLDCSWKFFYRNLIRIPSVYTPPQSFGNAIHYALHRMYQNAKESGVFDTKALIAAFEYKLQTEILSPQDYDDLYKKGVEVLKSYVEAYEHTFKTDALTEYTIKGVVVPFVYGDSSYELPLRGNIDKLEPYLDGYKVTDYKTGKRKTRNELLGKTKNSDGGYWRQIVFYKLLLDLYDTEAFPFRKGEIIFVVPDAKCVIHSEEFDVEDADIDMLKEEIRYAATEIMELKFSENACGKKDCEYCAML